MTRLAKALWHRERGVAELRWAAITLATMATSTAFHGFDRDTGRDPRHRRLGTGRVTTRHILLRASRSGPGVLAVAIMAAGLADVVTLTVPVGPRSSCWPWPTRR